MDKSADGGNKVAGAWGAGGSGGGMFGQRVLGSLFLTTAVQPCLMMFWCTCYHHNGEFMSFINKAMEMGVVTYFSEFWPSPFDPTAVFLIASFMAFELFLMRAVPGPRFEATLTSTGHLPVYCANGVSCYFITLAVLAYLMVYDDHYQYAGVVYDKFGEILSSLNFFAVFFCLMLSLKGLYFPSTKDCGSSGNLIVDYFWGTELYPRIFGWDVKQFTNCRFGMMYWQMGIIIYAFQQYKDMGWVSSSMMISVVLQSVYIFKFFLWETGYFCSMDIQHDRAGYYICWGCLVWVPSMYTIHTYFLVKHPVLLSPPVTALYLVCGLFSIWCNYDCDRQRQDFRKSGGKMKIWGSEPDYIVAKYVIDGKEKTSLLLVSGWWGLARHFHYIPEIMASFFWAVPGVFTHPLPFFYPLYLTILLADRAYRDDARCAEKYGKDWEDYCKKVPYKIIPGVI